MFRSTPSLPTLLIVLQSNLYLLMTLHPTEETDRTEMPTRATNWGSPPHHLKREGALCEEKKEGTCGGGGEGGGRRWSPRGQFIIPLI